MQAHRLILRPLGFALCTLLATPVLGQVDRATGQNEDNTPATLLVLRMLKSEPLQALSICRSVEIASRGFFDVRRSHLLPWLDRMTSSPVRKTGLAARAAVTRLRHPKVAALSQEMRTIIRDEGAMDGRDVDNLFSLLHAVERGTYGGEEAIEVELCIREMFLRLSVYPDYSPELLQYTLEKTCNSLNNGIGDPSERMSAMSCIVHLARKCTETGTPVNESAFTVCSFALLRATTSVGEQTLAVAFFSDHAREQDGVVLDRWVENTQQELNQAKQILIRLRRDDASSQHEKSDE